ncbi:rho guanine nucleotide exchange factor 5 isoform X2 [Drosophila grimshawi]|uniref:GH16327 n=1 Tax=Drosophila grimshawi TaxID=7222 RepID=B4IYC1_DROGR|nr:rho guanine nucleotide exchange factor 5 isoform X2 [Drosophila grimshawi]XP_032599332.1 rho guanine nucleotide exchange factor 5 isoform X2 [Drosophila grimshawi]EDV96571.1 GH16327 [Drosophila grimshawi]
MATNNSNNQNHNNQRLSCTSSITTASSNSGHAHVVEPLVTLPRKRRPRAVGEVSITCPTSSVYLNAAPPIPEDQPPAQSLPEPIYQNEAAAAAAAISQRCSASSNGSHKQRRRLQAHLSTLRVSYVEPHKGKPSRESMVVSTFVDDSDHYYETLCNKRHSSQLLPGQHQHQQLRRNPDGQGRASHRRSKQHSASAHVLGEHLGNNSDDYDSFETDSDEHTDEPEQRLHHHNDSGVDMRNHRLPDPPAPQNQVYAIVRKFRDFISNKKSPKSSQQKLYENTASSPNGNTQFYVECRKQQELFGNAGSLSSSERNLVTSQSQVEQQDHQLATASTLQRPKQKNGKSLRSRLRKSLVGTSFDTKQLSALTATRSTFYIEDPPTQQELELQHQHHQQQQLESEHLGSGELDSGFSEKASSGDIPVQTPSAESQKFSTMARKAKKEAKVLRRRATIGVRPIDPPPPPPPPASGGEHRQRLHTSWYAECGVFKHSQSAPGTTMNDEFATATPGANGCSSNSWYTESGLYQTSGNSVASSSGSSGVSTGNEAGLGDELQPHSLFSNEPLYQVYSAAKLESITRDLEAHEGSTDGYEEIGQHTQRPPTRSRPTALQLVEPKNGPSRTLWSQIPEVIHSCILPTLTPRERGLQEAKFEIMTSEASYLKSLNLLRSHFMNNDSFCDPSVLSVRDRKALFSYIAPVHECSERLLTQLECCWQNNIMLLGLSRCIYEMAEKHFNVYITFCEHQGRMDRTLRRLKEAKSGAFQQQLEKLEASASCCGLSLHSFLMMPMQRITRLPLLIDAVFSKESPHNADEYESWKLTLSLVQKIVAQCNEAANRCEQAYELERISRQLEFPSHIRALAIEPVGVPKQGVKPRFLVKRGELTHLMWRGDDAKLTFGKRFTKSSIYVFLFSDLLVLCKRKGDSNFTVFDYCPRSMLTLAAGDTLPQLPTKDIKDSTSKNLMLMTLLENYERKTIELVLSCPTVSDQQRWLEAMRPPEAETPGEKLYESWDCPQVIAKHSYESDEPDVLQLELGDVVNVSRKLPDGWYQGERIRDGAAGWFPGSYTEELNSAHVRARNLKQRHRLLTFTATYLEAQKGK